MNYCTTLYIVILYFKLLLSNEKLLPTSGDRYRAATKYLNLIYVNSNMY